MGFVNVDGAISGEFAVALSRLQVHLDRMSARASRVADFTQDIDNAMRTFPMLARTCVVDDQLHLVFLNAGQEMKITVTVDIQSKSMRDSQIACISVMLPDEQSIPLLKNKLNIAIAEKVKTGSSIRCVCDAVCETVHSQTNRQIKHVMSS